MRISPACHANLLIDLWYPAILAVTTKLTTGVPRMEHHEVMRATVDDYLLAKAVLAPQNRGDPVWGFWVE